MGFYLLKSLEQGSSEWLKWRRGVIGASDAPTIMGENPWSSSSYLMKDKMGLNPPFNGNDATREGQRLEVIARRALIAESGMKLNPVVIQDSNIPHIAASLDAISEDFQHLFEIKCGQKTYEHVSRAKEVPKYYFGQLQHMLMITQLPVLYFSCYRPDLPMLTLQVFPDTPYIKRLRIAEDKFARELTTIGHVKQTTFKGKFIN